jgi:hypothetical protein
MPSSATTNDPSVIASIHRSAFSGQWRKLSMEQRRQILKVLAGREDDESIRAAFLEVTTGQKALF